MEAPGLEARELPRNVLVVLFILGLTAGCLWVLRPFLTAIVGGTTIAISTWPMLLALQRRLGGRRWLAIAAMLTGLGMAIVAPAYFGAVATVQSAGALATWARDLPEHPLPPLPDPLVRVPLLGHRLETAWAELGAGGGEEIRARVSDHASEVLRWLMGRLGNLLGMFVVALMTLGITGVLYAQGEQVAAVLLRFARRLAGSRGEQAARLAALATRGVGLGVVLTPLIQAIVAGIGIAVAGVPRVGLFAVIVLVSCLAQIGPIPALLLPVAWLYLRGAMLQAGGLLAWALVVHVMGPIVRPLLIKRGVDLPLLLIISGVIGGVMAFGAVGLFIGPVLLAVGTTLLQSWIDEDAEGTPATAGLDAAGQVR